MKTWVTGICSLLFTVAYYLYLRGVATVAIEGRITTVIHTVCILFASISISLINKWGVETKIQQSLLHGMEIMVGATLVNVILGKLLIVNPYEGISVFIGGAALAIFFLLLNLRK